MVDTSLIKELLKNNKAALRYLGTKDADAINVRSCIIECFEMGERLASMVDDLQNQIIELQKPKIYGQDQK
jgi:hypothetical protein